MIFNNGKKLPFWDLLEGREAKHREQVFRTFKAKANARRSFSERLADKTTSRFGTLTFLIFNLLLFLFWVLANTGYIPGIRIFDPYPFNLLTMTVSLEAIILSIFVLISQNRAVKTEDIREEVELQINIIAERELTKLMKMVALLLEKHGVDMSQDEEYKKMIKSVSTAELEKKLQKEMSKR
jgi:uncharacterized membrane protein